MRGQPASGLTTYVSSVGSVDCINSCLTSPDLSFCFYLMEIFGKNSISIWDITGA